MKKSIFVMIGAVAVAATGFSPVAYARKHKAPAIMMMAPENPRMNSAGEFYATPMQAGMGGMGLPGLEVIPVAGNVAAGAVNGAGEVVGGVTGPLLAPLK